MIIPMIFVEYRLIGIIVFGVDSVVLIINV